MENPLPSKNILNSKVKVDYETCIELDLHLPRENFLLSFLYGLQKIGRST